MSGIIGATAGDNGTGGPSVGVVPPAGVLAGHYLLAAITVRGNVACDPNVSFKWSVRDDLSRYDGASKTYVFERTSDGVEPDTWWWTLNGFVGTPKASGVIIATSAQTIAGGTPRVNPVSAQCTANGLDLPISNPLIWFGGASVATALTGVPAGYTLGAQASSTGKKASLCTATAVAYKLGSPVGPTGDVVGTFGAAAHNVGVLLALWPA